MCTHMEHFRALFPVFLTALADRPSRLRTNTLSNHTPHPLYAQLSISAFAISRFLHRVVDLFFPPNFCGDLTLAPLLLFFPVAGPLFDPEPAALVGSEAAAPAAPVERGRAAAATAQHEVLQLAGLVDKVASRIAPVPRGGAKTREGDSSDRPAIV